VARRASAAAPDERDVARATELLRSKRAALYVGGSALDTHQLGLAQRIAQATGARVIMETFPSIVDRGAGVASPERLIYLSEFAISQLRDLEALVLIGTTAPVGFFAYPNVASQLVGDGCELLNVAPPGTDTRCALEAIVEELDAAALVVAPGERPGTPSGALTAQSFAAAVGATMPEDLIIADESNTSGLHLYGATQFAPPHRLMTLTGGAIGFGLPVALGAAIGSGQRVLALESDGSMMYTPQALWTMAREGLDVTVVGLSNRSYAILTLERQRVGAMSDGSTSQRMLDLDDPALDLCAVASAQGVPSTRVTSADELVSALQRSYATPGPTFIEAMLPKGLGN
jgi:acetolactate synthase-1/2/3 large subunit